MFPITLEICKRMGAYIGDQMKVPSKDGIDAKDVSDKIVILLTFSSSVQCAYNISISRIDISSIFKHSKPRLKASFSTKFQGVK